LKERREGKIEEEGRKKEEREEKRGKGRGIGK
jgi:hypothetical protein